LNILLNPGDMTYDEFLEKYKPVNNHIRLDSPFDNKMFETYDGELSFVKSNIKNGTVWTIVENNDDMWVIPGMFYINRIGYFVTEEPYENTDSAIVILID
jgi:hypothetical protein